MPVTWVSTPTGVSIAVHQLGGHGSVLLFAPANGFHGRCYQPVAAGLLNHYECWGIDLEGQGDSPVAEDCDVNMLQRHADDLLAVVDRLGCKGCFVYGHSGGGLAAVMAEQQQPGSFKAMYLYEPVVLGPISTAEDTHTNFMVDQNWIRSARLAQPPGLLPAMAAKRRRRFASKEEARQAFARKPMFSAFSADALTCYVEHGLRELPDGGVELKCAPSSEARVFSDVRSACEGAFKRLGEISCPVTVACGSNRALGGSFGAPEPEAPRIVAHLPRGRLEKYLTVGHMGPFENPPFLADRVTFNLSFAERPALWCTLPNLDIIKGPEARL